MVPSVVSRTIDEEAGGEGASSLPASDTGTGAGAGGPSDSARPLEHPASARTVMQTRASSTSGDLSAQREIRQTISPARAHDPDVSDGGLRALTHRAWISRSRSCPSHAGRRSESGRRRACPSAEPRTDVPDRIVSTPRRCPSPRWCLAVPRARRVICRQNVARGGTEGDCAATPC